MLKKTIVLFFTNFTHNNARNTLYIYNHQLNDWSIGFIVSVHNSLRKENSESGSLRLDVLLMFVGVFNSERRFVINFHVELVSLFIWRLVSIVIQVVGNNV